MGLTGLFLRRFPGLVRRSKGLVLCVLLLIFMSESYLNFLKYPLRSWLPPLTAGASLRDRAPLFIRRSDPNRGVKVGVKVPR